jgi:hypothetical protein
MKLARFVSIAMLAIIVTIGLLSSVFLPRIQAALLMSGGQPNALSVAGMGKSMSTAVRATPAKAQPMSMVLAQDTFQRANHVFWGIASDGQMWGADANSLPGFTTMNHSGRIINGQGAYNAILGPPSTNADIVFSGSLSRFRLTNLGSVLRWQDKNDWYKAYLDGTQLGLIKNVNGTMTRLKTGIFTAQANSFYSLRFRVVGSQLMARAWATGQAEPQNWLVMATDNTFTNGFGGLRPFVVKGINVTITSFIETSVANS